MQTVKISIKSSIVIEGIKTLIFFKKNSNKKRSKQKAFKQIKNTLITLLEYYNHYGKILIIKLSKN